MAIFVVNWNVNVRGRCCVRKTQKICVQCLIVYLHGLWLKISWRYIDHVWWNIMCKIFNQFDSNQNPKFPKCVSNNSFELRSIFWSYRLAQMSPYCSDEIKLFWYIVYMTIGSSIYLWIFDEVQTAVDSWHSLLGTVQALWKVPFYGSNWKSLISFVLLSIYIEYK